MSKLRRSRRGRGNLGASVRRAKKTTQGRSAGRLQRALDEAADRVVRQALTEENGNVVRTAAALGITTKALYKRLVSLDIDPARYRK